MMKIVSYGVIKRYDSETIYKEIDKIICQWKVNKMTRRRWIFFQPSYSPFF